MQSDDTTAAELTDAWSRTTLAMAESTLTLAQEATSAALSMWSSIISPGSAVAELAPSKPAERFVPRLVEAESRPSLPAEPRASYDPPKSWYRAPYRSPFDPMFWLEPFGRLDVTPGMVPSLPQAMTMQPSAFAQMFAGFGSPFSAMFGAQPQNPAMPAAMAAFTSIAPQFAQSWAPFVSGWLAGSACQRVLDAPLTQVQADAARMFSDFSTYRSPGGYAVANVIVEPPRVTEKRAEEMVAPWVRLLFPWLPD